MIANIFFLLWVLAVAVPIYWAVPARWIALRLVVINLVSFLLLYLLSPVILVGVLGYLLSVLGVLGLQRAGVAIVTLKRLSWSFFVPLLFVPYIPLEFVVRGLLGDSALSQAGIMGFALLGFSYTAIRSFMLVRQSLEGTPARLLEQAATLLFFGSFSAGPISNAKPWQALEARLTGEMAVVAGARFLWGAAAFLVLSPAMQALPTQDWFGLAACSMPAAWVGLWQNFLALYLDFSGYTHIAIACGLLFGARLPENFSWPLRSTSIQEFWQRWHRSLGAFISMYLFKPLVRKFGKPTLAIFMAFVFVGIWHQASVLYLLWGVGHGAALALNMMWTKSETARALPAGLKYPRVVLGWFVTISYVAMLSALANAESMSAAMATGAQLFGFGGCP